MKKKSFEFLTAPLLWLFKKANLCNVSILERAFPSYTHSLKEKKLRFYCPNSLTLWRAKTLFTKEPDTIAWINTFSATDIFYDIGANVGMYSVYAAARGASVYAFEPETQNHALLNYNVYLNQLGDKISALNVALSDKTQLGHLSVRDMMGGQALHMFGSTLDYNNQSFNPVFKQAVCAYALDDFVKQFQVPLPDHIKIDIDGLEQLVLRGAQQVFSHPGLKSILIELNTASAQDKEIIEKLQQHNFDCLGKYHIPFANQTEFKNVYNFVFVRQTIQAAARQRLEKFYEKVLI